MIFLETKISKEFRILIFNLKRPNTQSHDISLFNNPEFTQQVVEGWTRRVLEDDPNYPFRLDFAPSFAIVR